MCHDVTFWLVKPNYKPWKVESQGIKKVLKHEFAIIIMILKI